MKNLSDERLESLFRDKLNDYEDDPAEDSWEKVLIQLPAESFQSTRRIKILAGCVIMVAISVLLVYTYVSDSDQSEKVLTKRITHIPNDQKASENLKSREGDSASGTQHDSVSSQTSLMPGQRFASQVGLSRFFLTDVSSNSSELMDNGNESSTSNLLKSSDKSGNIWPESNSLEADTTVLKSEVGIDSVWSNQMTDSKKPDKKSLFSGDWIVRISPVYSAGVFRPLRNDNVEIDNFSQSTNFLKNRLGLIFGVGYTHKLIHKAKLEYSLGYKIGSKCFEYEIVGFNGERIEVAKRRVSGLMQGVQLGVALQTALFHPDQSVVFSITYESLLGKGQRIFSPYVSKSLLYYGVGIERKLTDRVSLQSGLSYGVPLGNKFEHFILNPLQLNAGISWRIEK